MRRTILLACLVAGIAGATPAAVPPPMVNYQGVLRDASDVALSGSYDVAFRFFSAEAGGDEILVDSHTLASGGQVTATGGLFDVRLGSGALADGAGPGTYTDLAAVFRDFEPVWLELQIGAETLSPRVRIVSAPYALNADYLDGRSASDFAAAAHQHLGSDITSVVPDSDKLDGQHASYFLDTSSAAQTKSGQLTINAQLNVNNSVSGQTAVHANGTVSSLGIGRFENGAADGDALQGLNFAASGTSTGRGVVGQTAQSAGPGVSGINTNASGTGVLGAGNNQTGSYLTAGSGGAFTGSTTGLLSYATTSGTAQAVYTNVFGTIVRVNYWSGSTQYKIYGTGTVSSIVKDLEEQPVTIHAPEAPEILLMDFGQGRILNGFAHVDLDPVFAKNVVSSSAHPIRVFVQLEENEKSSGVVVANKTPQGFDVVELDGGRSSAPFQWQVVANRADEALSRDRISRNADMRFEPAPPELAIAPQGGAAPAADETEQASAPARSSAHAKPTADLAREIQAGPPATGSAPLGSALLAETAAPHGPPAAVGPVTLFPARGDVEEGDVLSLDPDLSGRVGRAAFPSDPTVVGIVGGEPAVVEGQLQVPVTGTGFALVKVDASYGSVLPGDLLAASATPGHAMRAPADPAPGSVIGKALEPLESGKRLIRVLLMAH
jgi:hypothetical protein